MVISYKLKTILYASLLCVLAVKSFAQTGIDFSVEYKKGHQYTQLLDSHTHTVATYTGNSTRLNELKTKGMKNPTISDKQLQLACKVQCMSTLVNGRMIMNMQFNKALGNILHIPQNYAARIHLHKYAGKKPVIDSVSIRITPVDFKNQWKPMVQTMLEQMVFPARKINVGGSMREVTSQQLPIGNKTYSILVTTIYTLKKVTTDSAWFDMMQTFTQKTEPKDNKAAIKGTGTGKMVLDVKNHFIAHKEITSDLTIKITQGNLNVESVEHNIAIEKINMTN